MAVDAESKVRLKRRVSSLGDLKKKGASRVALFLHSVFKEQALPQSGESPANARRFDGSGVSSARVGPWQPEPALPSWLSACTSALVTG